MCHNKSRNLSPSKPSPLASVVHLVEEQYSDNQSEGNAYDMFTDNQSEGDTYNIMFAVISDRVDPIVLDVCINSMHVKMELDTMHRYQSSVCRFTAHLHKSLTMPPWKSLQQFWTPTLGMPSHTKERSNIQVVD